MSVRLFAAMAAGLVLSGASAVAQELDGPVNLPPPGFDGVQFVDNAGCAFARAGISGNVVWVPRVDQSRQQICGLAPTFGAAAPVAVAEAPAPEPAPAPAPELAAEPVAAPTPMTAAAAEEPGAPIRTVASMVTPPAPPAAVAEPMTTTESGPPAMTLAEACERQAATGVRLIDVSTGSPIPCADARVAEAAPVPPAVPAPSPAGREMTLADACAEQAATGVRFRDMGTGELIACPEAEAPMVVATAPAPVPAPRDVATVATVAQTVAAQTPRRVDPLSSATISGTLALGPTGPIRAGDVLSAETISGVVTQVYYGAPDGYQPVWADGRINPDRGLPETQARVPVAAAATVSTMNAPQPQAAAQGGFVQVGTYGDPANAARAEAALRGLGLPVAVSRITRDGRALQVVAAGPLTADALQAALGAARAAGYGDAFIR